jgi:hypothetical protein
MDQKLISNKIYQKMINRINSIMIDLEKEHNFLEKI